MLKSHRLPTLETKTTQTYVALAWVTVMWHFLTCFGQFNPKNLWKIFRYRNEPIKSTETRQGGKNTRSYPNLLHPCICSCHVMKKEEEKDSIPVINVMFWTCFIDVWKTCPYIESCWCTSLMARKTDFFTWMDCVYRKKSTHQQQQIKRTQTSNTHIHTHTHTHGKDISMSFALPHGRKLIEETLLSWHSFYCIPYLQSAGIHAYKYIHIILFQEQIFSNLNLDNITCSLSSTHIETVLKLPKKYWNLTHGKLT